MPGMCHNSFRKICKSWTLPLKSPEFNTAFLKSSQESQDSKLAILSYQKFSSKKKRRRRRKQLNQKQTQENWHFNWESPLPTSLPKSPCKIWFHQAPERTQDEGCRRFQRLHLPGRAHPDYRSYMLCLLELWLFGSFLSLERDLLVSLWSLLRHQESSRKAACLAEHPRQPAKASACFLASAGPSSEKSWY